MSDLFFIDRIGEDAAPSEKGTPAKSPASKQKEADNQYPPSRSIEFSPSDEQNNQPHQEEDVEVEEYINSVKNTKSKQPQRKNRKRNKRKNSQPVWVDEDDEIQQVDLLQVPRRKKLRKDQSERNVSVNEYQKRLQIISTEKQQAYNRGPGSWAQEKEEETDEDEDEDEQEQDEFDSDIDVDADIENEKEEEGEEEESTNISSRSKFSKQIQLLMRSANTSVNESRRSRMKQKKAKEQDEGKTDVVNRPKKLSKNVLDLRIVTNANIQEPSNCEARCIQFHPTGRMIMVAGLDKTVRLFHIDGKKNTKLQSIHLQNYPIQDAKFVSGGSKIITVGQQRKPLQRIDLESGRVLPVRSLQKGAFWNKICTSTLNHDLIGLSTSKNGHISIVNEKSMRCVGEFRLNNRVMNMSFDKNNAHQFLTNDFNGQVYVWDLRTMKCINNYHDEGSIHSTSLSASIRHYAIGSDSGVVNIYNHNHGNQNLNQKPIKSFMNLTTQIDNLSFNHDGKLLTFASHDKKDAIRIAHMDSMTVYTNWPTEKMSLRRVCSTAFSPGGGYLAVGISSGDVKLMRLMDYPAY